MWDARAKEKGNRRARGEVVGSGFKWITVLRNRRIVEINFDKFTSYYDMLALLIICSVGAIQERQVDCLIIYRKKLPWKGHP